MRYSLGQKLLRRWRVGKVPKMTQMTAAGLVGIDLFHYAKIETGKCGVGLRLALKFQEVAGIEPRDWTLPAPDDDGVEDPAAAS